VEQINALAKKERVPARIAKGDLEGKMKCRIWRKLHAEEAKRFDQVYDLMEKNPGVELADAFGALQSGLSVPEFLARKARTQQKAAVKEARSSVPAEAIDGYVNGLIESKREIAVVLAERTFFDVLTAVEPIAFAFASHGRLDKVQVVLLANRGHWEQIGSALTRDPRLAQKPMAISRQPSKRPVADPRPFAPQIGQNITLTLRNGIVLEQPLMHIGPFDLLLGTPGEELFVPLHAIARVGA
jgi:hypothetical protein